MKIDDKIKQYGKQYMILIYFDPDHTKTFRIGWLNVRHNRYCIRYPRLFQHENGSWDFSIDDFDTESNVSASRITQKVNSRLKKNPEYKIILKHLMRLKMAEWERMKVS